jgi:hypothetical protein
MRCRLAVLPCQLTLQLGLTCPLPAWQLACLCCSPCCPQELRQHASPDMVVMLVGNKVDLASQREVASEQGQELGALEQLCSCCSLLWCTGAGQRHR